MVDVKGWIIRRAGVGSKRGRPCRSCVGRVVELRHHGDPVDLIGTFPQIARTTDGTVAEHETGDLLSHCNGGDALLRIPLGAGVID